MTGHVTIPAAALAEELPPWVTLLRAPNPGPMTLDGTNTWLLRAPGHETGVVIDPGPDDPEHLARIAGQGPIRSVLITHGHPDHVEGARHLSEMLGGVPVLAADPAHRVCGWGFDPGERLDMFGLDITVLDTPGHTADSVSFLVGSAGPTVGQARPGGATAGGPVGAAAERAVFTGDTILGRGTTVVAHPDGDLGHYLASLATLGAYEGISALPGHGPALADCAVAARFYLAHRHARLDQVRQALAAGARTAPEVVAMVYAEVDRSLWWAAEWSVQAQLAYLDRQSRESAPGPDRLDPA